MIEFIPLQSYAFVVNTILMVAVALLALLVIRHPQAVVEHPGINNKVASALGEMLVIAMCVLIGLRPISYAFGDMGNYYKNFLEYAAGAPPEGQDYSSCYAHECTCCLCVGRASAYLGLTGRWASYSSLRMFPFMGSQSMASATAWQCRCSHLRSRIAGGGQGY